MINLEIEDIIFSNFIQKNIDILYIDSDGSECILKQGKLINFKIKMPFLYFNMEIKNKLRDFPLPIPFKYRHKDELLFSYDIRDMCEDENMIDKMRKMGDNTESKIFDKIIYVRANIS